MNRAGSWPAMASTTSHRPTGVSGSIIASIIASNCADCSRTAFGVKPRLTRRRCWRWRGSSLAIMFDSVGVSFSR